MKVEFSIIDRVLKYGVAVAAALLIGTAVLMPGLTSGVAAGAAIAFLNIYGSRVLLPLAIGDGQMRLGWSLLLMTKFMLAFSLLAIAFFIFKVDAVGLMAGYGGLFFLGVGFALIHQTMTVPAPDAG